MPLVVASSQAGAPYETYNFSHNSAFAEVTTGEDGNSARGGNNNTTQNFQGSTSTFSLTESGSVGTFFVDTDGNAFGQTQTYTQTSSGSHGTTSAESAGTSFFSVIAKRTAGGTIINNNSANSGQATFLLQDTSGSGTFTIEPATFGDTTTTTQLAIYVTTSTVTNSEDFYGLWYLTTAASNSLGTELVYTSTSKRPVTAFISSTLTLMSSTSSTCIRSHKSKFVIFQDTAVLGDIFPNLNARNFLFANTSQPSFNTNGLYLASVVLPTAGGYTTSTEYTFSTTHVDVAGESAANVITFDFPIPDPDQTYPVFENGTPESVNMSEHALIEYPDALFGQLKLTTRTYTEDSKFSNSSSEGSIYETSDQILIAAYGSPDTHSTSNPNNDRTIGATSFFALNTFQTRAIITSFFGSSNVRVPQAFIATATYEQKGIDGNGTTSTSFGNSSGTTTHEYGQSRAQATNFRLADVGFAGQQIFGFEERGGGGAGVSVIFTESAYLDFYLQDPFSKGLSHPLALELTGGFSDLGLIGAGYSNPANFFNYQDNLLGGIAVFEGGNNLNFIQACHRINVSGVYSNDFFGNTNASCPPTQNITASWLSQPEETTGTSQFITYAFGTSPTYSITTANKRSNPTATITSGTNTHRWATDGAPVSGFAGLLGFNVLSYRQNVPLSTFGLTFDPAFGQALVVTDISSNQSSTTREIRGFMGSDYTPQSVIPFSVTREVGIQQQIGVSPYIDDEQLGLYWVGEQVGVPFYRRPHPTSYVGFLGLLTNTGVRIAGASVGDNIVGYPFFDVTAQFSDPSF